MPTWLISLSPPQRTALQNVLHQARQELLERCERPKHPAGLARLDILNIHRLDSVLYQLAHQPIPERAELREEEFAGLRQTCALIAETEDLEPLTQYTSALMHFLLSRMAAERIPPPDIRDDLPRPKPPPRSEPNG